MATKKLIKKKEKLAAIEKERQTLINLFFKDCELIEGSYRESMMRCGRDGCHCNEKPGHLVARISRWENGKLKNKVVRIDDRDWVKKRAGNYKQHKQALSKLKNLNDKENAILKAVMKSKMRTYD